MKKLAFLLAVVFLSVSVFGQTATTKDPVKTTKTTQVKHTPKTDVAANQTKTTKTVADTTKAKVVTKKDGLKKDGTPDKRFKDNKTTKPAAGPLKKDGTKDMRFKANKDTTKVKK
jgi:LAS superfamily LD-carboxypeptidase LdcB